VPLDEMGPLLTRLVRERPGKSKPVPSDIRTEAVIAERVLSDISQVNTLGDQVPYNCPGCGGVLWELNTRGEKRYRCHTGHSYTERSLLASQSEKIEEMLWISLRMFEERKNLLTSVANGARSPKSKSANRTKAVETQGYIDRIRGMLLKPSAQTADDTLSRVKAEMAEPRRARSTR
jgi:two-component system chemotaxis response regulator CheB